VLLSGSGLPRRISTFDWRAETVRCPQGIVSPRWKPTVADGKPRLSALFRRVDCRACTVRQQCTGNVDGKGRHLLLLPESLQETQTRARALQQTPEWKRHYALRAGCEATVSELSMLMGCVTADTADSSRPTFSTSSPPPAPTSFDSPNTAPTHVDDREAAYSNSSTP
jgi:hypothetical protein